MSNALTEPPLYSPLIIGDRTAQPWWEWFVNIYNNVEQNVLTLADFEFTGDSGSGSVDLNTQSLDFQGTTNQVTTAASNQQITFSLPQDIHAEASPKFVGLTLSGLTQGQVVFPGVGGVLSGSANLFWDGSNSYLGIGTNSPSYTLDVDGTGNFTDNVFMATDKYIDFDGGQIYGNTSDLIIKAGLGGVTQIFDGSGNECVNCDDGVVVFNRLAAAAAAFYTISPDTKATLGVSIDQKGNDDIILAFQDSTDVSHPFTDFADEDTYGSGQKYNASGGGLLWRGFAKDQEGVVGAAIEGYVVDSDAGACVVLEGFFSDGGTGKASVDAGSSLLVVKNNNISAFTVSGNGDLDVTGKINLWTLPPADGEAHQPLVTDGAGQLGWGGIRSMVHVAYDEIVPSYTNNLLSEIVYKLSSVVKETLTISRNSLDRISTIVSTTGGETLTYNYNGTGFMTSAVRT